MATTDLSHYNPEKVPDASKFYFAIIVSEWNYDITGNLLKGAMETLTKHGCPESQILVHHVPGSYELPIGAQFVLEKKDYIDAVICLGNVIQGETKHFDFVCEACAQGVKDVSLKYNKAVIFGVLTDNNKDQSIARSGGKLGNKGVECAVAAIKMAQLKRDIG
jgi:6,7-dimethyl-8-ribityllumazine synthase